MNIIIYDDLLQTIFAKVFRLVSSRHKEGSLNHSPPEFTTHDDARTGLAWRGTRFQLPVPSSVSLTIFNDKQKQCPHNLFFSQKIIRFAKSHTHAVCFNYNYSASDRNRS